MKIRSAEKTKMKKVCKDQTLDVFCILGCNTYAFHSFIEELGHDHISIQRVLLFNNNYKNCIRLNRNMLYQQYMNTSAF